MVNKSYLGNISRNKYVRICIYKKTVQANVCVWSYKSFRLLLSKLSENIFARIFVYGSRFEILFDSFNFLAFEKIKINCSIRILFELQQNLPPLSKMFLYAKKAEEETP